MSVSLRVENEQAFLALCPAVVAGMSMVAAPFHSLIHARWHAV